MWAGITAFEGATAQAARPGPQDRPWTRDKVKIIAGFPHQDKKNGAHSFFRVLQACYQGGLPQEPGGGKIRKKSLDSNRRGRIRAKNSSRSPMIS